MDQLREHDWRPRRLRQKTHKTNEAIRQIAKRLGHEPNFEEISAELNLTADEYQEYLCWRMRVRWKAWMKFSH